MSSSPGSWPGWTWPPESGVIVTGAASGIGQATAVLAARLGLKVAAWDLDAGAVGATIERAEEHGENILPVAGDVTDAAAVTAAMAATTEWVQPAFLVNNAGPTSLGTDWDFDQVIAAAVGSVHRVSEAFLATEPPAGASIVNISSVVGIFVAPPRSAARRTRHDRARGRRPTAAWSSPRAARSATRGRRASGPWAAVPRGMVGRWLARQRRPLRRAKHRSGSPT